MFESHYNTRGIIETTRFYTEMLTDRSFGTNTVRNTRHEQMKIYRSTIDSGEQFITTDNN